MIPAIKQVPSRVITGSRIIRAAAVAWLLFAGVGPSTAGAQTYIEPTTPLGGPTAAPINTSATTQRKAGSLIIGTPGGTPARLCLNTDTVTQVNPTLCIASWSELGGITGNYVLAHANDVWTDTNGDLIPDPPSAAQTGYARIKGGAANNQLYTVIAEAPNLTNAAALYAYVDPTYTNGWAGYFSGRVYIGDGTGTSAKKLCLNDTDDFPADPNFNYKGCITSWNDIAGAISGGFVFLQSAPGPLNVQDGGEALTGAGVFGTSSTSTGGIVLGIPPPTASVCLTCGDGICEADGIAPDETPANCPAGGAPASCPNVPRGDC